MAKLIVGCGYLGSRVARRWLAAGDEVAAVTRSRQRVEQLRREGLRPLVADVTRPETLRGLPPAETVLYTVGYDPRSGNSRWEVYAQGLRTVLDALPPETGRVILISSTGVYGQTDGGWVDEDSPCQPTREAGRALLAAEEVLGGHKLGGRGIVLRLAGIYGPGRIPRKADILAGRPLAVPSGEYLNLIHVDDAAAAVLAAESRAKPPRTYLVADGHPAGRQAFLSRLAKLLGAPAPQFVEPDPDAPAARRAGTNKRVGNARLLAELEIRLEYPTYREGLAATVAAEA